MIDGEYIPIFLSEQTLESVFLKISLSRSLEDPLMTAMKRLKDYAARTTSRAVALKLHLDKRSDDCAIFGLNGQEVSDVIDVFIDTISADGATTDCFAIKIDVIKEMTLVFASAGVGAASLYAGWGGVAEAHGVNSDALSWYNAIANRVGDEGIDSRTINQVFSSYGAEHDLGIAAIAPPDTEFGEALRAGTYSTGVIFSDQRKPVPLGVIAPWDDPAAAGRYVVVADQSSPLFTSMNEVDFMSDEWRVIAYGNGNTASVYERSDQRVVLDSVKVGRLNTQSTMAEFWELMDAIEYEPDLTSSTSSLSILEFFR